MGLGDFRALTRYMRHATVGLLDEGVGEIRSDLQNLPHTYIHTNFELG